MKFRPECNIEYLDNFGRDSLPGHSGFRTVEVRENYLRAELTITASALNPYGILHGGSVVTMADTACGYACIAHLPPGAKGFTTIELKTNFLGSAKDGTVVCEARAVHIGRSTHVWDATVRHKESGRTLALFRCTQMVLQGEAANAEFDSPRIGTREQLKVVA